MADLSISQVKLYIDQMTMICVGKREHFDVVGGNEEDGWELGPADGDRREQFLREILEIADHVLDSLQSVRLSSPDLVELVAATRCDWPVRFFVPPVVGARDQLNFFRNTARQIGLGKVLHRSEKGAYAVELGSVLTRLIARIFEARNHVVPTDEIRIKKMTPSDVPDGCKREDFPEDAYVFYEDSWAEHCGSIPPLEMSTIENWVDAAILALAESLSGLRSQGVSAPKLNESVLGCENLYGEGTWISRVQDPSRLRKAFQDLDYSFYWLSSPFLPETRAEFVKELVADLSKCLSGKGVQGKEEARYSGLPEDIEKLLSPSELKNRECELLKSGFVECLKTRLS